jgi:hypothetical protein
MTEQTTERRPWHRQPGETDKAYLAFTIYRDLGPKRTLQTTREKLGKNSGYNRVLELWSSEHRWGERAAAYDAHLDEVRLNAIEDRVTRLTEKHVKAAQSLIDKGLERLSDLDIEDMGPGDARMYLADGIRLQRLALGLSTDNCRQEVSSTVHIDHGGTVRRILDDPVAAKLACDLIERIGPGQDDPGRVRDGDLERPLEHGKAPGPPEP